MRRTTIKEEEDRRSLGLGGAPREETFILESALIQSHRRHFPQSLMHTPSRSLFWRELLLRLFKIINSTYSWFGDRWSCFFAAYVLLDVRTTQKPPFCFPFHSLDQHAMLSLALNAPVCPFLAILSCMIVPILRFASLVGCVP